MPAVGERQKRDFADGQDWGRGAAVAALAVGMADGVWRSGLGFEGLVGCVPELFGTLRQVAGGDFMAGVGEELLSQAGVLVCHG